MNRRSRISILAGSLVVVSVLLLSRGKSVAAEELSRIQDSIETTIINVDKYGVYVPNIVFYWDTQMSKEKTTALTGLANRLRNREAVITYSAIDSLEKDKRPLVVDIAPYDAKSQQSADASGSSEAAGEVRESRPEAAGRDAEEREGEQPGITADNGPVEEQNGSRLADAESPITREEVARFINRCVEANSSRDLNAALACYADQVDYYSRGMVDKNIIKRDKGYYFRNWDKISSTVGNISLIVTDQRDLRIVTFTSYFIVSNAKQTISGQAENIWKIKRVHNRLEIVDEKQRVISRESQ
jgi:hypothetical protein